jgi:hypothetical protein
VYYSLSKIAYPVSNGMNEYSQHGAYLHDRFMKRCNREGDDISYFFNMFIEGHTFLPAIGRIFAIVKIKVQQRFSLPFQKRIDSQLE